MATLFTDAGVAQMEARMNQLKPDSKALWGKMNVSQMMEHCDRLLEVALGERIVKTNFVFKLIGPIFKAKFAKEGVPFNRNSPTGKDFIISDTLGFEPAREKLVTDLKRFSERGQAGALGDRHPFFGKMSLRDWEIMQWKHLDHHLQQFGV